jgi:hypothetical protein
MSLEELEQLKSAQHPQSKENENARKCKRVSFQTKEELQQVELIAPSSEWSEEEQLSRWHSQEDYGNFRSDVFHTLYLLRNHPESLDGVTYTARGVECRDPAVVGRRQHVKHLAWQAVFDEQEALRKDASTENSSRQDDWMATLYSSAARPALREALDLAALDEIQAKEIHNEGKKQGDVYHDEDSFSDDWIRSISSHSTSSTTSEDSSFVPSNSGDESGFCVFGAASASGFDDDWIRGD